MKATEGARGPGKLAPALLAAALAALMLAGCATPVTLYTDKDKHAARKLVEPFTRETGIPVDVIEFESGRDIADNIARFQDGEYVKVKHKTLYNYADVVFSSDIMMGEALKTRGMLLPYSPDAAAAIPAGAKRDGWWYGMGGQAWVLMWNTDLVADAPESLLDLAGPSFPEGSVALVNPNYMLYYYSGACARLGRDAVVPFLQTMIDRKTQWEALPRDAAALVADGRAHACLTKLNDALPLENAGAHVAWAVPDQAEGQMGAYLLYNTVCLSKVSTMPDAARKLADYLLTPEAEKLSVELGLSDATLRECGAQAPVVRPLDADLASAQAAMNNDLGMLLTYFTSANPDYEGK